MKQKDKCFLLFRQPLDKIYQKFAASTQDSTVSIQNKIFFWIWFKWFDPNYRENLI
jgi:hypothetical protein